MFLPSAKQCNLNTVHRIADIDNFQILNTNLHMLFYSLLTNYERKQALFYAHAQLKKLLFTCISKKKGHNSKRFILRIIAPIGLT